MPLVMGLVGLIGLLILSAVGIADLAGMFKAMRRERARAVAPQPVLAIDLRTQARLTELAGQGNKIKAISELMAATGLGLKEAKDAVDAIAAGQDVSTALQSRQDIPADTEERARELIAQGRKIQAVKLIREQTGLGLKEAKDVADAIAAGQDVSTALQSRQDIPADTEERARELIAQGRKIQAVKLIREQTGLGLKEAKDVADGLGRFNPGQ